jgi:hypothetical protein
VAGGCALDSVAAVVVAADCEVDCGAAESLLEVAGLGGRVRGVEVGSARREAEAAEETENALVCDARDDTEARDPREPRDAVYNTK